MPPCRRAAGAPGSAIRERNLDYRVPCRLGGLAWGGNPGAFRAAARFAGTSRRAPESATFWLVFTGIVESMGRIEAVIAEPPGVLLRVASAIIADGVALGDSIAIDGCCLTVVAAAEGCLDFQAGEETLSKTTLGRRGAGDQVNLERSLRPQDRMGGHFVTGHIDGVGRVLERTDDGEWSWFVFGADPPLMRQMASKGSIAIDGVSLTLVDVLADRFSIALIPHTLQATTLGRRQVGDPVNLETDLLAKYVQRQLGMGGPQDARENEA